MTKTLELKSPAKLNLNLHIVGRRPDGYHLLESYFQLIDLSDTIRFSIAEHQGINIEPAMPGVDTKNNLIFMAAQSLRELVNKPTLGVNISIEKKLPMGGGIGGGSSNAATTLIALNHLWNLNLTNAQLCSLGLTLGADIPVFIHGNSAWVEGVGDIITPVDREERWYVLIHPQIHISTSDIFNHPQLTRNTPNIKVSTVLDGAGHNDCEAVVKKLYPEVDYSLKCLSKFAPARLTGTGSCVFAEFKDRKSAVSAQAQLPKTLKSFVTRGINESPLKHFF